MAPNQTDTAESTSGAPDAPAVDDWDDGGDPFAMAPDSTTHAPAASDAKVAAAFGDLFDDSIRAGGALQRADLNRLIVRRGLNGAQAAELLGLLHDAHVVTDETPEDDDLDDVERHGAGLNLVRTYLLEIASHKLIYAEDEVRLGMAIQTGQLARNELDQRLPAAPGCIQALEQAVVAGRRAHDTLVQANLRLVVSIAKLRKYTWSSVEFLDRIQDGNIGLLRAADKFDATLGYKFSTYATWWIRQQIERGIADRGRLIRVPVHAHETGQRVRAVRHRLDASLGRKPTLAELAAELGMDAGSVQAVLDWSRPVLSLDQPVGSTGDVTLGDLLADDADVDGRNDPAEVVMHAALVRDVRDYLVRTAGDERSADVIRGRFGLNPDGEIRTLEELGQAHGVTRERIRQIETKTLKRLRSSKALAPLWEHLREYDYCRRTPPQIDADGKPVAPQEPAVDGVHA